MPYAPCYFLTKRVDGSEYSLRGGASVDGPLKGTIDFLSGLLNFRENPFRSMIIKVRRKPDDPDGCGDM